MCVRAYRYTSVPLPAKGVLFSLSFSSRPWSAVDAFYVKDIIKEVFFYLTLTDGVNFL